MTQLAKERQMEIESHLNKKISYEFWYVSANSVSIEISWGDWKHEHLYLQDLMAEIGWKKIATQITEDDGSDTYSAVHTFIHS